MIIFKPRIFDILRIPDDDVLYFHNGRFYAYKNLFIDLTTKQCIDLKPITSENSLFRQLNIKHELPSTHSLVYKPVSGQSYGYLPDFIGLQILKIKYNLVLIDYYEEEVSGKFCQLLHYKNNICMLNEQNCNE